MIGGKPDIKATKNNKIVFWCEIKEIKEDNRDYSEGSIDDNTFDKIALAMKDAHRQLSSVNLCHSVPNIIAFYNRLSENGIDDFESVVTGIYMKNECATSYLSPSEALHNICDKIMDFDLCIWFNEGEKEPYFLSNPESIFRSDLIELFR